LPLPTLRTAPPRITVAQDAFASGFRHDQETGACAGCLYDVDGRRIDSSERVGGIGGDRAPTDNPPWLERPDAPVLAGRSLYLGSFIAQYGHFIVESLSAAWALKRVGPVDHFVFHSFVFGDEMPAYARSMLSVLGVAPERVQVLTEPVGFEEVLAPDRLTVLNQDSHVLMRETYRELAAHYGAEGPRRLYLSRSRLHQDRRRLENEAEIDAVAAEAGYAVVHPQELPIETQMRLYGACEVMAGLAGSALHNVVFCRPGVRLINLCDARSRGGVQRTQAICNLLAEAEVAVVPFHDEAGRWAEVNAIRDALRNG
jgi:capsular polysaccharide biosynthesis protein